MPALEEWGDERPAKMPLRGYQRDGYASYLEIRAKGYSKIGVDWSGGLGKTRLLGYIAEQEYARSGKPACVIEFRDNMVRQTAARLEAETNLSVEIEMGKERASPFTPIVAMSAHTGARINRLTGWADDHFSIIIVDESHHALAPSTLRIINYFHYGAESLVGGWVKPKDGEYTPKAIILGTSATWDIGAKRNLGVLFQCFIEPRISYLEAVQMGWLVPPRMINVPVKLDLRKLRIAATEHGNDFSKKELGLLMEPVIEELAAQHCKYASERKSIAFLPSVECARLFHEAVRRRGLNSIFIHGEMDEAPDEIKRFQLAPRGTVLSNCSMVVEGSDFVDCDCVGWYRATISKAFYKQGNYRPNRVLAGVVNDAMTDEERRAAIAASDKKDSLHIDPLFVSDRIDLCEHFDLLTDDPEVKKAMRAGVSVDGANVSDVVEAATRDAIKALEKAAKKEAAKEARMINPLTHGLALDHEALKNYRPQEAWEAKPVNDFQREGLLALGYNANEVKDAGQADIILKRMHDRKAMKLASPKQMEQLRKLTKVRDGRVVPMFTEDEIVAMRGSQAGAILGRCAPWTKGGQIQRARDAGKIVDYQRWSGTQVG